MTGVERLPTGCAPIDDLLAGGLEREAITQVYGPPGSGKTNLALTVAVQTIRNGGRVLYLDTEGFSPDRFDQILRGHGDEDIDIEEATDRLAIKQIHDFEEQHAAIRETSDLADDLDLVVLDSATGFYRLERAVESSEGDALRTVTRQVTQLLGVARKHGVAVLLTNQVFADPEEDRIRPLGGHTLAHWSGTILRLDRYRAGRRRATLEKHRSLPAGETVEFQITETGIDCVTEPL